MAENPDSFVRTRLKTLLGDDWIDSRSLSSTDEIRINLIRLRSLVTTGWLNEGNRERLYREFVDGRPLAQSSVSTMARDLQLEQVGTKATDVSMFSLGALGFESSTFRQLNGQQGLDIFGGAGTAKGSTFDSVQSEMDAIKDAFDRFASTPTTSPTPTPTVTGTGTRTTTTGGRGINVSTQQSTSAGADRVLTGGATGGTTNVQQPADTGGPGNPGDGNADMPDAHEGVFGIPAGGEVWKIDGKTWAVAYQTTKGGPWIYYTVPDDDSLKTFFPGGVPRTRNLTQEEVDRFGAITPGSTYLLRQDGQFTEGWEEGFNKTLKRESLLRPWLKDPEVVATYLAAALEGRTPTAADLESTEYFSKRSDAEIDYVAFTARATSDELDQYHLQFKDTIRKQMVDAGIRSPDESIVNFVSQKWASGQWSDAYASRQVIALSNPFSSVEMDDDLKQLVDGVGLDTLRGQSEAVKAEVQRWLGPLHSKGFSDEWYRQWAGAIMDDPNAENDLRDFLQGQRMSLYPEYENPNLTYEDISGVWAGTMQREWGVTPADDKEWQVLDRVIRANDAAKAGMILREEGINLGIEQVQRRAMEGFGANIGGQVVPSF